MSTILHPLERDLRWIDQPLTLNLLFSQYLQEIHAKIMSLAFEDCKVYISNVDSQSSAEGGIIVQVIGEMSNSNGAWRKFAQTFFLAEQPNGYFVLNDICRYIKEEGDEDVTPAPASTSAQPEQSSSSPAPVPSASPSNDNAPTSVKSVLFNDVKPAQDLVKEEESTTVASSEPATAESSFTFGSEAVAAQPNGKDAATVNGDAEKVEEPAAAVEVEPLTEVEHKSNEAPPPLIEEPAPPAPVVEEVKKADKEEEIAESVAPVESKAPVESAPSEPTPPTPQASSSPAPASTPAPASPAVSAPAPAPTPAAPAAPKSWASLAASNTNKWGSMASASKGASAAPQVSISYTLKYHLELLLIPHFSIRSKLNPRLLLLLLPPPRTLPLLLLLPLNLPQTSLNKFKLSYTRTASSRVSSNSSRRSN